MTDGELADALLAWARSVVTEIVGAYDHLPKRHTQGWPELGVGVMRRALTDTVVGVGRAGQQQLFDARDCELVVAVKPEPQEAQTDALRDFGGRLLGSIRSDNTLGGRVEVLSPLVAVDYEPGQIVADDGSEALGLTLNLTVAERVPAP